MLEGFLGAELPAGDYEIKMVYHCPGLLRGLIATLLGILCFYGIYRMEQYMRRKQGIRKETVSYEVEDQVNV